MPTTIDRPPPSRALPLKGVLAVALAWFAGMAAMALVIKPDAVVVFGPSDRMISAIVASDGALLDAGRFHIAARTGASTVGSLYAAGAWLVWPLIGRGCGRG
ncbi:hypothetical protein ACQR10_23925 [Bradyrhizobium sp. HKCCYLRH2060]|uniref:hypothetical protein n=1 Tax=Bradyrhizobium TaxID=374 RepID=UPI0028E3EBB2|nr:MULTISPECIES: hypothetical protein [unclassified Bradyrhizobium]